MKRGRLWCVVVSFVLAVSAGGMAVSQEVCGPPRCHDLAVPVPEGLIVPEPTVRVLLPEGYEESGLHYPVVYVLHGVGDTFRTWTENTDLVAFSEDLEVILVMPDGGRGSEAGWYSDWADGSRHWETFHTQVLAGFVDSTFRTLGDGGRGVMGLSMGGFGAMSYAARHPGLFGAAASFSGAVDTMLVAPASGLGFATLSGAFGTPDDRVWGNQLTEGDSWRDHNPTDRAADLSGTKLFVSTGMGTPGGAAGDDPANPGAYGLELFIRLMNDSFASALRQAGVAFEQNFYPGGYHGWPYWESELHRTLPRVLEAIGLARAAEPEAPAAVPVLPDTGGSPPSGFSAGWLVLLAMPALPAAGYLVARRGRS